MPEGITDEATDTEAPAADVTDTEGAPAPEDAGEGGGTGSSIQSLEDALAALEAARKDAAKYRTRVRELEPLEEAARAAEEAQKTELQRAQERAEAAERERAEIQARLARMEVAAAKGLTPEQAEALVGNTAEEMAAYADRLLELFAKPSEEPTPSLSQRPATALKGGREPTPEVVELDPAKLAVKRRTF